MMGEMRINERSRALASGIMLKNNYCMECASPILQKARESLSFPLRWNDQMKPPGAHRDERP